MLMRDDRWPEEYAKGTQKVIEEGEQESCERKTLYKTGKRSF